jgi:ParB/RepB/Spo0J family partition protein
MSFLTKKEEEVKDGSLMYCRLGDIVVQPGFNVRRNTTPEVEVIDSVKVHGIINPIHINVKKNGILILIDGHRRLKAAEAAGMGSIPAIVHKDMSDEEALVLSLTANEGQKKLSKKEQFAGFARLKGYGYSIPDIARIMGEEIRMVHDGLKVSEKAVPAVRKAAEKGVKEGGISTRLASRVSTLPEKEQRKIIPELKGVTREEGLKKVREEEKKLGIVSHGRKPLASTPKGSFFAADYEARGRHLDTWLKQKINENVGQTQLGFVRMQRLLEYLKGNATIDDILKWDKK